MARSVNIYFSNNINQTLTLQASSTGGTWTKSPPQSIPATTDDVGGPPKNWGVDSSGSSEDAGGSVVYSIGSTSQNLSMTWTSLAGKVNSYTISGPAGYSMNAGGSDGSAATGSYFLNYLPVNGSAEDDNSAQEEDSGSGE